MLVQTILDVSVDISTKNSGARPFRRCTYENIYELN